MSFSDTKSFRSSERLLLARLGMMEVESVTMTYWLLTEWLVIWLMVRCRGGGRWSGRDSCLVMEPKKVRMGEPVVGGWEPIVTDAVEEARLREDALTGGCLK